MKTHSIMLRGYDDNRSIDRSEERHTAPSAMRCKANRKKKNRVSTFSTPSQYVLPSVDPSAERHTAPSATMYNKNRQKKFRESTFSKPSLYVLPRVYSSKKR